MVECRYAMRQNRAFRCVAFLATVAFLWTIALSASPELHQRVHSDANRVEHSCAVTSIASGHVHHSSPPVLIDSGIPNYPNQQCVFQVAHCVLSCFLSAAIFEHAPPVRS